MKRFIRRTFLLACLGAAVTSAVFVSVASANYGGAVSLTCTSATYTFTNFPAGAQDVLETVFVDDVVAVQATFSFVGPVSGPSTVQFTVPNDGQPHFIEADAYSLTNGTPVFGFPGVATLTCGTPPPPSVCTYTKGFYRNHAAATAAVIAGMGGTVQVGGTALTAAQAQAVLNTTPGTPSNVTFTSNVLLNLVQQLITAELNVARGSTAPASVQAAIASTNAAVSATLAGGQIQLSSSLADGGAVATLESFNSANDCG